MQFNEDQQRQLKPENKKEPEDYGGLVTGCLVSQYIFAEAIKEET